MFWEELFHQETLYPAMYAALPWLWSFAPRNTNTLYALSTIVQCAQDRHESHESTRFAGLGVTQAAYDAAPFGPQVTYTDDELGILKALEIWFDGAQHEMAKACLDAAYDIAGAEHTADSSAFPVLLAAHFALKAPNSVSLTIEQFHKGNSLEEMTIEFQEEFVTHDKKAAENTLCYLHELLPVLAQFDANLGAVITEFTLTQMQALGLIPVDRNTPDLFL